MLSPYNKNNHNVTDNNNNVIVGVGCRPIEQEV